MRFHPFDHQFGRSIAQRLIAEHARWLTRALRSGHRHPQIPRQRVSEGGFARLVATPEGRRIAEHWWSRPLERLD